MRRKLFFIHSGVNMARSKGSTRAFANKKMVLTLPALSSFDIIARHKGLGGVFSLVLPLRALAGQHI
jgi:hypothetical protein